MKRTPIRGKYMTVNVDKVVRLAGWTQRASDAHFRSVEKQLGKAEDIWGVLQEMTNEMGALLAERGNKREWKAFKRHLDLTVAARREIRIYEEWRSQLICGFGNIVIKI